MGRVQQRWDDLSRWRVVILIFWFWLLLNIREASRETRLLSGFIYTHILPHCSGAGQRVEHTHFHLCDRYIPQYMRRALIARRTSNAFKCNIDIVLKSYNAGTHQKSLLARFSHHGRIGISIITEDMRVNIIGTSSRDCTGHWFTFITHYFFRRQGWVDYYNISLPLQESFSFWRTFQSYIFSYIYAFLDGGIDKYCQMIS